MMSELDRISGFPRRWQQLIETIDRVAVDHAGEDIAGIGVGFYIVAFGHLCLRAKRCPAGTAAITAGEEVVLAAEGYGADGALDGIGVKPNAAVGEKGRQPGPARVSDRIGQFAAAGDTGKLRFQLDTQDVVNQLGQAPPHRKPAQR
jgi:hypothetical protein